MLQLQKPCQSLLDPDPKKYIITVKPFTVFKTKVQANITNWSVFQDYTVRLNQLGVAVLDSADMFF